MNGRLNLRQERTGFTACPQDIEERPHAEILDSHQNLGPPIGVDIVQPGLIHHANDCEWPLTQLNPCAGGIPLREVTPGNLGIDHRFGHAILTIRAEGTAGAAACP